MSDRTMIVVSHRGWDGSRILGIFHSLDDAKKGVKDFKYDPKKEELIFDIMNIGKISKSASSVQQGKTGIIERTHTYQF